MIGTKGKTGTRGVDGDPGSQGVAGAIGDRGQRGGMGETGPKGEQGPQGLTGNTGLPGPKREAVGRQVWMDVRESLACQVPRVLLKNLEALGKLAFKDSLVNREARVQKVKLERRVLKVTWAFLDFQDHQACQE
ncbi:EMI domain-containing protein 1-like isoform X3 [Carassius auratus]|nr:EMI domain-containing protein 1-like isoform X3 [Carassius auratus]XP_026133962.1 EMI domain-containing protein 1-like isoform X3 [Carassius auratus]XP_026133963.1 EMI domain-containing protein 1-like isoform X3 [Carassius auratus]XP_026133964.1 EMI domain-containing protein 1-like isoform X3 [Carassius auratus]XP_026133965.1 EMI domain-containing protein 1-like isoform X3 [Carassius auratus]XP_026133966.1 EMI domain-containing protein 1-like isoform X3 [Carassius auratus]XP_026133967.1 EM